MALQQAMVGTAAKEKIEKLFEKGDDHRVSASAYDTAWVAMVPSPNNKPSSPQFPGCLNWILHNQHKDGSWGIHPNLLRNRKDALSSTLACVLALKRWGIGNQHVHNALGFMERQSGCLRDSSQQNPIGFDVIFPAMVEAAAVDFDLSLPLDAGVVDPMLRKRDDWLRMMATSSSCSKGHNAYLAYISEGMGNSRRHWQTALSFQRSNGSLLNSPSATAAAFIHLRDSNSLHYLASIFDDDHHLLLPAAGVAAVPTSYPHQVQTRLSLIDGIRNLGIQHHFRDQIKRGLDEIYTCWMQGDEDIFLDPTNCAMAFRILRLNGYPVFPDVFSRFTEDRFWKETMEGYLEDEKAVLELYKASRVILPGETILEHQQLWTKEFLIQLRGDQESTHHYSNRPKPHKSVITEVNNVLTYPFQADLESLARKRTIEQYSTDTTRILKSSFSSPYFGGHDFLTLASDDFTSLQLLYREELGNLMLWLKEKRLDELKLAKPKMSYGYFHALAVFSDPDHSDARSIFCKHASLVGLIDDLFDIYGTHEEHLNLVHLLQRWDPVGPKVKFSSERVETLYWALHSTICETAEKALPVHGQSSSKIMDHVVELWVGLLKGMVQETEWSRTKTVPTLEQYMTTASITIALGPIFLPALYCAGDELSEEVIRSAQFQKLLHHTSTCGRLLNDSRGFQREAAEGKPNAVSLRMSCRSSSSAEAEEAAMEEIESLIEDLTRQVLRMALDEETCSPTPGIPASVRYMFWETMKSFHLLYMKEDLFNSTKFAKVVRSFIDDPIASAQGMNSSEQLCIPSVPNNKKLFEGQVKCDPVTAVLQEENNHLFSRTRQMKHRQVDKFYL
ncbi:unnamed protein product [Linum trigynum]|uniref:Uncharacterized protein n=1 Tax=Linum trigynum TaxID=586398 RepID=A0AAV2DYH0_9ROSI